MIDVSSTQQTFLIVNGLIVTLVVLSFFLIKKGPRPPVKLDLTAGKTEPPREKAAAAKGPPAASSQAMSKTEYRPRQRMPLIDEDGDTSPGRPLPGDEIPLNVLFNWNGHTWDAYEVLGLPAGSSRDKVAGALQAARAKADPESFPFLQAAHDAIMRS